MDRLNTPGENIFYVYVHSRLDTGEPFYVGKGHERRAFTRNGRGAHWNNIVAKHGGLYVSCVARNLDEDLAFLIEVELIDKYRQAGVRLTNMTDGGEGTSGRKATLETRAQMSASATGFKHTREARAKMSEWRKGKPLSRETRSRMSAAATGRIFSDETRARIAAALRGKSPSTETRAKQSDLLRGKPWSEARRAAQLKRYSHG